MKKVAVYNQQGEKLKELDLNAAVFGVRARPALIQQMTTATQANRRSSIAHTKTRGEVRGGGKKPWRQKGTGRARHGSTRSPIWVGGGITFGPRSDRNWAQTMPTKMRQTAIRMVLSDKVKHDQLIVLDAFTLEQPKTKALITALAKLPTTAPSRLLALDTKQENIIRASRNLPRFKTIDVRHVNLLDLLQYQSVIVTEPGIKLMEKQLAPKRTTVTA